MVKEINKDIKSLSTESVAFDLNDDLDGELLRDMLDTAEAHKEKLCRSCSDSSWCS